MSPTATSSRVPTGVAAQRCSFGAVPFFCMVVPCLTSYLPPLQSTVQVREHNFNEHKITGGVGFKMLQKMGWGGDALGKHEDVRSPANFALLLCSAADDDVVWRRVMHAGHCRTDRDHHEPGHARLVRGR